MRLIPNWRAVALRAWSNRFIAGAIFVQGLSECAPYLQGFVPMPDWLFSILVFVLSVAAIISRHLEQGNLKNE